MKRRRNNYNSTHQLCKLTGKNTIEKALMAAPLELIKKTCTTRFLLTLKIYGIEWEDYENSSADPMVEFQIFLRKLLKKMPHVTDKHEGKLIRKEMIKSKCSREEAQKRVARARRALVRPYAAKMAKLLGWTNHGLPGYKEVGRK